MYANPELGYQEIQAARRLSDRLETAGFSVARGIAGMPTAFQAVYRGSSDRPRIALFAEYDALPQIGHACGHNIIGTAAMGAALALAEAWPELPASIAVLGSPAEEGGAVENAGGKVHLLNHGFLSGIDAAMMIHPATDGNTAFPMMMTREAIEMTFRGRTAQPAGSAHEGINALEAAVLAYTAINALRQYLKPDIWVHGVITDGGRAPNIVPDVAVMRFYVRGLDIGEVTESAEKVRTAAQASARAVGASVEFREYNQKYLTMLNNQIIGKAFEANLRTLSLDVTKPQEHARGSTDMGNVSWVVPSIHPTIHLGPASEIGNTHSPHFADATVAPSGCKALLDSAKALAMTAFDLISAPELLADAHSEFEGAKTRPN